MVAASASEAQAGPRGSRGRRDMPTLMSVPTIGGVNIEGMDKVRHIPVAAHFSA